MPLDRDANNRLNDRQGMQTMQSRLYTGMQRVNILDSSGRGEVTGRTANINIDYDVRMTSMQSVRGTTYWGKSIGTSGITACQARVIVNSEGAMIYHYIASDVLGEPPIVESFRNRERPLLDVLIRGSEYFGDRYNTADWRTGTVAVAVVMPTDRNFEVYVDHFDRNASMRQAAGVNPLQASSSSSLASSGSYNEDMFAGIDTSS